MLRVRETSQIDRLLSRTRAGQGGGLLLRGEPGIGKSALLAYAREQAGGFCVLEAAGAALLIALEADRRPNAIRMAAACGSGKRSTRARSGVTSWCTVA